MQLRISVQDGALIYQQIFEQVNIAGYGSEWRVLFGGSRFEFESSASRIGARVVEERTPTLDEILVARAGGEGS